MIFYTNSAFSRISIMTSLNSDNNPLIPSIISNIPVTAQHPLVQGVDPISQRTFPVRMFKIFGIIQISLGVLVGIVSVIGVGIESGAAKREYNECLNSYRYDSYYGYRRYSYYSCIRQSYFSHVRFSFDLTCFICSGWFILTGCLPFCMNKNRITRFRNLKIAFMVCCIIGASVFAPTMFMLGVSGAMIRSSYDSKAAALSALSSICTFSEMVVAIVAASYCCCCTPWGNANQKVYVVYQNAAQPGMIVNLPQNQTPMVTTQNVMIPVGQYTMAEQNQASGQENQTHATPDNINHSPDTPPYKEQF